jgi:hypothetical protein
MVELIISDGSFITLGAFRSVGRRRRRRRRRRRLGIPLKKQLDGYNHEAKTGHLFT